MDDSKKIITPSSPNPIASGNNENESENHRNLQQKTKNFMSPTISASSKMISPKKGILSEWKPTILDSKSELYKMGISNSNSRNSFTKNPLISSPKNGGINSDENLNDEEKSVLDSYTDKPYDPLTNYLSPRPKYLRYNPNRKRKLLIQRGKKLGSISPNGSIGCLSSSSSSESSSKNEDYEGIKQNDEQEIVEDEEVEEEVIQGRNWGFKGVIFKGLIVFFAWLFFTVFISSMNVPTNYPDNSTSGSKIGYENFDNVTLKVVSFLNVDSVRLIDKFDVDMIETPAKIVANFEENQESKEEKLDFDLDNEEDIRTLDDVKDMIDMNADFYQLDGFKDEDEDIPMIVETQNEKGEVEILDSGLNSENRVKDIVAPIIVSGHNVVNQDEKLVDFDRKMNDGDLANEVEVVAEGSTDDIEQKTKGEFVNETTDLVSSDVLSQNVAEVPYVKSDDNVVESEEKMNVRPNGGFENEVVIGSEGSSNDIEQKNEGGYDHEKAASVPEDKDVSLTGNDRIVLGVACVLIWVGIMVFICWHKCKKAFTKTNTSKRRINPRVERSQNRRNVGLPRTVDERLDQVHQESESQVMNTNLSSVVASEGTSRRFPVVKQLGELEFTRGFSGSVKSTGLRSGNMQQEDSVFAVPDDRKAKKSKSSHTPPPLPPPESPSISSKISAGMTTMQLDGTEEVSAVRRSERLKNRGITSP